MHNPIIKIEVQGIMVVKMFAYSYSDPDNYIFAGVYTSGQVPQTTQIRG
jgi:hypothetical protein